jgi:exosortase
MSVPVDLVPAPIAITPDRASTTAGRWRRPLTALVGIELVVVFGPTVAWLIDRWTMSVWQNAHGMFVPPLAAWFAWQALKERPDLPVASSAWGFVFLIPALMLHAVDAGMHTQLLSAVALFAAIPGLALLMLGIPRVRVIAFPLTFLWFALPIPLAFTEPLQLVLRGIAAESTAWLLPRLGLSVFIEGTTLYTVGGVVDVTDACSGFSTLYAAMTVGTLVAYMTETWKRSAVVLIAAAPVAILANVLRVLALTLMVALGEAWLLDTFVHPLSGMLTFALALPVLFWLGERPAAKGGA